MTSPNWTPDFNEANRLIRKVYSIDYIMPKFEVISEADYRIKFMSSAKSMKDIIRPTALMAYDDKKIYAVEENNILGYPSRIFVFAHEISHAIALQLNNDLSIDNVTEMMYNDDADVREKGVSYYGFNEGIADFMAVTACSKSLDKQLVNDMKDVDKSHAENLVDFKRMYGDLLITMYSIKNDNNDWPHILARAHKKNNGCNIQCSPYVFGYNFVKNHADINIKELIMNPPRTYEELTIPEVYTSRIARTHFT